MASNSHTRSQEEVIAHLTTAFSSILNSDTIHSVAYNCRFNMKEAGERLFEMASSMMNQRKQSSSPAVRKAPPNSVDEIYQKELHIQRVINFVKEGWRVLILLRGLPGSGKTYLANMVFKEAVDSYSKQDFILSTDDFFCKSGTYNFNSQNLQEAHVSNQRRCYISMKKGISPIIIDNTNIRLWEMRPYCLMAAEFGYCIELLEPTTSWAYDVQSLAKKNVHRVGVEKLAEMLTRYEADVTPDKISRMYNLRYNVPLPQKRRIPPVITAKGEDPEDGKKHLPAWNSTMRVYSADKVEVAKSTVPLEYVHPVEARRGDSLLNREATKTDIPEYIHEFKTTDHMRGRTKDQADSQTRLATIDDLLAFQSNHFEPDKAQKPNSALIDLNMDTSSEVSCDQTSNNAGGVDEMLRKEFGKLDGANTEFARLRDELEENKNEKTSSPFSSNLKAWGLTEKALVSWEVVSPLPAVNSLQSKLGKWQTGKAAEDDAPVEKSSRGTNTSVFDFNMARNCAPEDGLTILTSQNRIITEGIVSKSPSPPKKILVDKSSMTNEEVLVAALKRENPSAENLEKLVQLFPGIPKEFLSDFYDKCVRDLNWTVDLLMENGPENICSTQGEETKEVDGNDVANEEEKPQDEKTDDLISFEVESTEETPLIQEDADKIERELLKRQEREQLKKHLEESVDIKKEHYSDKLWQIVNFKRGTPIKSDDAQAKENGDAQNAEDTPPSSSFQGDIYEDAAVFVSDDEFANDGEEESEVEDLIEINLGRELVDRLGLMFGGVETDRFQPIVQMPQSFARQLHALYLESISRQMETQRDAFMREDEAFAKKLQDEEEQTLIQKQQESSNLKEIMDEQFALNLYKKDVDKWKGTSPDDLASKLTRQKLFENFPAVDKDLLVEILQAHNYCYRQTVETLLDSTDSDNTRGNQEHLKEPPISDGTLQEMKSAQESVIKTVNENEVRSAVSYRKEANKHMRKRRENLQKVQMYHQRGMNEVAAFYANISKQQLQLAELANQKASCRFLEENAYKLTSNTTLDLHYLYVKEALPTLDIFIDHHISYLIKEKKASENLYIITGRGKRSEGGVSKLKPAVIRRLKSRSIQYHPTNEGLLRIKVHKNLLMSAHLNSGN